MIYTKSGDKGKTSLVGGSRVSKADIRVEAYGTVDELNSHIGLLVEWISFEDIKIQLIEIQNHLFTIQTLLATEKEDVYKTLTQISSADIANIEKSIDKINDGLPKLKSFVIPGGSISSAQSHIARTVCRRAERCIVRLNEINPIDENILIYINRLSDFLFVLARKTLQLENTEERYWN